MIYKRKVKIMPVVRNKTYFQKINSITLEDGTSNLSATGPSVKYMISRDDEMQILLPTIIDVSPNNMNWAKRVSDYWNNISIPISKSGKDLDASIRFDFNSTNGKIRENIKSLVKSSNSKITDTSSLAKYVMESGNVAEEDVYNYGIPVNISQYLLYRFVLVHGEVANSKSLISKAPNKIRFYIHTPGEEIKEQEAKYNEGIELDKLYIERVVKDQSFADALLILMSTTSEGVVTKAPSDFSDANAIQRHLYTLKSTEPDRMYKLLKGDKSKLLARAEINNFIYKGLLRRLSNTSIIVDPNSPENVIGNTIDDAIAFLRSQKGKSYYDELKVRYKQAITNKVPN